MVTGATRNLVPSKSITAFSEPVRSIIISVCPGYGEPAMWMDFLLIGAVTTAVTSPERAIATAFSIHAIDALPAFSDITPSSISPRVKSVGSIIERGPSFPNSLLALWSTCSLPINTMSYISSKKPS